MVFASQFDRKEIDAAGRVLASATAEGVDDGEWVAAFKLVSQWRGVHAGPLRTFRNNLGRRVGRRGIVAQRLKRMPTIRSKLEKKPWLQLSRMNDIGGCRAIVPTAEEAFRVGIGLLDSRIRHELVRRDDYIDRPRDTGYRGLHLVYRYVSDRNPHWQGIKTEIQLRSRLQHQWATAVETIGLFTGDDLKSNLGDVRWLRFLALMSSVVARIETSPVVPETPTDKTQLKREIKHLAEELDAETQLAMYATLASSRLPRQSRSNSLLVLELNLQLREISGLLFRPNESEAASDFYADEELAHRDDPNFVVVMVSVNSLNQLKRAYPNFFADLSVFRKLVGETIA